MRIGDLGGGEAVGGARGCPRDPAPVARFMVFAVGGRNARQDALSEVLASPFFLGGGGGQLFVGRSASAICVTDEQKLCSGAGGWAGRVLGSGGSRSAAVSSIATGGRGGGGWEHGARSLCCDTT